MCPSIFWNCPPTIIFNIDIVDASNQSKIPIFSPISTPTIPNNPILLSSLFSPTYNTDLMIRFIIFVRIIEYPSLVIIQQLIRINRTCQRSSLNKFIHNVKFPFNMSILFNCINQIFIRDLTQFSSTICTFYSVLAYCSISMSSSSVRTTCFIRDTIFMNILISSVSISTFTAIVTHFTRYQYLWTYIDIRPTTVSHYFDPITHRTSTSKCPA